LLLIFVISISICACADGVIPKVTSCGVLLYCGAGA